MMNSFQIVCNALAGMTSEQLQEVRQRCTVLLQGGALKAQAIATPVSGPENEADRALILLCDFAQARGIEMSTFAMLKQSRGYAAFCKHAEAVHRYWRDVSTNKLELDKLTAFGIKALHKYTIEFGWTVDTRTLMRNYYRIPSIIDQKFPGYRQAGMLGLLLLPKAKHGTELTR